LWLLLLLLLLLPLLLQARHHQSPAKSSQCGSLLRGLLPSTVSAAIS
jgi:hypothetical protein